MEEHIPPDFKYASVIRKGKPVHRGDYFSLRHPSMQRGKRAKIFAPFAALKGFEEEVSSKDIVYEYRRIPSPEEILELDRQLSVLAEKTRTRREAERNRILVTAEYYVPCTDPHNDAYRIRGIYETVTDIVRRADPFAQILQIGEKNIRTEDIFRIRIHND